MADVDPTTQVEKLAVTEAGTNFLHPLIADPKEAASAVRGKIGGETFYSFVSTPRDLLKIAFINHQALNHPDGRPSGRALIQPLH
jgi:hypothetical protein